MLKVKIKRKCSAYPQQNDGPRKRVKSSEKADSVTVAIIGSAGRSSAMRKHLGPQTLSEIAQQAEQQMVMWGLWDVEKGPLRPIRLVSGGSAWVDHVVIRLFLQYHEKNVGATLYLPCALQADGKFSSDTQCGIALNRYHWYQNRIEKRKQTTHQELCQAIKLGLKVNTDFTGFKKRNAQVARSDFLMAFTVGGTRQQPVARSGTLHTWNLCKASYKQSFPII